MSRFPVRRVVLGFTMGAVAGWVAGLLRRPESAPAGSSADEAIHLPREDFGAAPPVEEHAPPRKATAKTVRPAPGSKQKAAATGGGAEPAKPAAAKPAKPAKPAAKAAPRKRATKAADPAEAAAAALREGHAEATERLAGAEAAATPPPAPEPTPAARRRRRPPA